MQAVESKKKNNPVEVKSQFPRRHLIAAGALGVVLVATLGLSSPSSEASKRLPQTIALPLHAADTIHAEIAPTEFTNTDNSDAKPADMDLAIEPEYHWRDYKVKSGDSLALLFKRAGLSAGEMYRLIHSSKEAKQLARVYPGKVLSFALNEQGNLQALRYTEDRLTTVTFERTENGFAYQRDVRQPDVHYAYRTAEINNSLFSAGKKAGLSDNLIMELAGIFGWDIDFALDIRKGDSFELLFEEEFLDGEKIGDGKIVAAAFTNQGETFRAVRYTHANGDSHYYTPEGKSMRKAFLRAPVDFTRISSNFNPNRLHPIFKTKRPHRGIDYAAATGTPVMASGDGRVIKSVYSKASGNLVVIQHSNNIQTKYLHLHKRKVKTGQRVKQGQLIGTVGSTGYATGPHLHYEFVLNGVHRNPRTILNKLPKAKSIPATELARFKSQTQPHLAQLKALKQSTALAYIN